MKSSVNEVWIKSAFYVFNTVFDGEYDRKFKKNKKFPQPGFEPTTLKKESLSQRVTKKASLLKSHF